MPRIETIQTSGGYLAFMVNDLGEVQHMRHGPTVEEAVNRVIVASFGDDR